MQQALDNDRRYLPAGHADIALRLGNLGYMDFRAGDIQDALAKAEEALAMYWTVYGAPHPDMPYAMATIADAALALGDTARADSMHIAALDMRRGLLGSDHQDLYRGYRDLGQHMLATGRAALPGRDLHRRAGRFDTLMAAGRGPPPRTLRARVVTTFLRPAVRGGSRSRRTGQEKTPGRMATGRSP